MASVFGHTAVALTGSTLFSKGVLTRSVIITGVLLSIMPDIDVLSFRFGIPYTHWLGHRGITHSIFFAAIFSGLIALLFRKKAGRSKGVLWLYFFLCLGSHGVLDAMTSGGRGVGFFIPFSLERHFLPFRPILVSPIEIEDFFGSWGLRVIQSETVWILLPCLLIVAGVWVVRRVRA
ncbi:MAG: metal-dependent hydrolase [Saprospiraceae bacterium]|nr:metal-dependent hydrolase [Saprospiraceae bacterium]